VLRHAASCTPEQQALTRAVESCFMRVEDNVTGSTTQSDFLF
jgi:hypothetical protein